jgi:chromosome segregation ATPase
MNELFLPLNLQFFATDEQGGGSTNENVNENGNGQSSDGKGNTDTKKTDNKEIMIPKSRFDEVNNAYKELKTKLEEIEEANKQAEAERKRKEQEEAEKRGEFENLYNQTKARLEDEQANHKTAKERIEVLEGVINGLLDAKLESIDKEFHDLIPDNLTPEQKLSWVTKAEQKGLFKQADSNTPLGEPTNPKEGTEEIDVNKMNPFQMLLSGYGRK